MLRGMRTINTLVIHCSASPNGKAVTAADIDAWHAARGFQRKDHWAKSWQVQFPHLGYHWVVQLDGALINGRYFAEVGAHAAGHNATSMGLCLVGTDRFSAAQWEALADKVRKLQSGFPGIAVVGHRDLSPDINGDGKIEPCEWLKTCPGFDVARWLADDMTPLPEHVLEERPCLL